MAKAALYDQYEDVGMAFSDEEVAGWDPVAWGEGRVTYLLQQSRVLLRRSELNLGKDEWWILAAKTVYETATWYCYALELPGLDKEIAQALPSANSKDGKALTGMALDLDPDVWVTTFTAGAEAALGFTVTIGRRALSREGWTKKQTRMGNKLANCIMKEVSGGRRLEAKLLSHSG
jgi:hypothetical protein